AAAAAPIDQAIFNALVGGGAMFKTSAQAKMGQPETFSFAFTKASFKLQSEVAFDQIDSEFHQAGVSGDAAVMLATAGANFATQVKQANDVQGLVAAKTTFKTAMFGQQDTTQGSLIEQLATLIANLHAALTNVKATVDPLAANLKTALG